MKQKTPKIIILIVCLVIAFAPAIFGGLFTSQSVGSEWYLDNKPGFTPPGWVFGPVWTILYFLIGLSLFFVWTNANKKIDKKKIALVFGINLILNALWSFVFFGMQNALLAFLIIIGIWLSILGMVFVSYKIDKKAAWMLVPYLLWVSFAGVLNAGFSG
jgi:translocator protein